jgi:hypothetical protein
LLLNFKNKSKQQNFLPKKTKIKTVIKKKFIFYKTFSTSNILFKSSYIKLNLINNFLYTITSVNNNNTIIRYIQLKLYYSFLTKYSNLYTLLFVQNLYNPFFNNSVFSKLPLLDSKTLLLSFKKGRFFPTLLSLHGRHTYITSSLGIFLPFFLKPKSFKKSKQLYTLLAHFFRKIILYTSIKSLNIHVNHVPKYFSEILNIILLKNLNLYKHPFTENSINEKDMTSDNTFKISNLVFFKTKLYGSIKLRKRGVLKRKVTRKVIKNNYIID